MWYSALDSAFAHTANTQTDAFPEKVLQIIPWRAWPVPSSDLPSPDSWSAATQLAINIGQTLCEILRTENVGMHSSTHFNGCLRRRSGVGWIIYYCINWIKPYSIQKALFSFYVRPTYHKSKQTFLKTF